MMERKNAGLLQKVLMVALAIVTVIASACTVFAYEPMQSSDESFNEIVSNDSKNFFSYDFEISNLVNNFDFSEGNEIFVYPDGTQITINSEVSEHALCIHSMVNGYFSSHESKSNGGCIVTIYTCQRCNKCGYLANAKYYNTVTYAKCPH